MVATLQRLAGQPVIVMGAGSIGAGWSNGKACAVAYAHEGALVACVDRDSERATETAEAIQAAGGTAFAIEADATSEQDACRVVERTVDRFGSVSVLHNNVGVGGSAGTPDEITPEVWDREIRQNLTTAYLGIRCVVPAMRQAGGGTIINSSSLLAVRFLRRPNVAYTASKAAVEALTRACATAYGRDNIRVNCIRIGFSETPLMWSSLAGLPAEEQEQAMARSRHKVPLGAMHSTPFDVAAAAVFLASPEAKHLTGVILNVDGGLECAPI